MISFFFYVDTFYFLFHSFISTVLISQKDIKESKVIVESVQKQSETLAIKGTAVYIEKRCSERLPALGHYGERWDICYGNWDMLCLSEDVCPLVFTDRIDTLPLGIFTEVV